MKKVKKLGNEVMRARKIEGKFESEEKKQRYRGRGREKVFFGKKGDHLCIIIKLCFLYEAIEFFN